MTKSEENSSDSYETASILTNERPSICNENSDVIKENLSTNSLNAEAGHSLSMKLAKTSPECNIYAAGKRIKIFPILNYSTLYHSLLNLIEIIPAVQQSQIGEWIWVWFIIFQEKYFVC